MGGKNSFSSVDPAQEEIVWEGQAASVEEVRAAVLRAREALAAWSSTSFQERVQFVRRFAEELEEHREELTIAISREVGKPLWESRGEVQAMIQKVEISVRAAQERCLAVVQEEGASRRAVRYRPHGVVAVLGPFNFPGHLPNGHIVPALLAGNCVCFKPSEHAPLVGEMMARYWEKASLPEGVLTLLQGGRETGVALSQQEGLDGLFFTGSWETGRQFLEQQALFPGRILALEMGGNNPLVVGEIAELEAGAYVALQSAYLTTGQRCSCARRLIVPKGAQGDAFLELLVSLMQKIRVGSYRSDPEPFMGPLISAGAREQLFSKEREWQERGAHSLVPLSRMEGSGFFLTPGLIDVTTVGEREDAEVFGPLLQVVRVSSFTEALVEANRTAYGLSASLLSDQSEEYELFYKHIRAGIVNWNLPTTGARSDLPFGGVGKSGNYRPSAYFAADYTSYPVASLESSKLSLPEHLPPGL